MIAYIFIKVILLAWFFLAPVLGISLVLNYIKLIYYLKQNRPKIFEKLCLNIPIINIRPMGIFNPLNWLIYMIIDDSDDDKQSLHYKNRFHLLALIGLIYVAITSYIILNIK